MSSSSCLESVGKYLQGIFKKMIFLKQKYKSGQSRDGFYSNNDSQDEQELACLMEENIVHPFNEEIRVIVHKNSDIDEEDSIHENET